MEVHLWAGVGIGGWGLQLLGGHGEDVELAHGVVVDHNLVDKYRRVERAYLNVVAVAGEIDIDVDNDLSALFGGLPLRRMGIGAHAHYLRLAIVDTHRQPYVVAQIVGHGYGSYPHDSLASEFGEEGVGQAATGRHHHRLHAVAKHRDRLYPLGGAAEMAGVAGYGIADIEIERLGALLGKALDGVVRQRAGELGLCHQGHVGKREGMLPLAAEHAGKLAVERQQLLVGCPAAHGRGQCLIVANERTGAAYMARLLSLQLLDRHEPCCPDGVVDPGEERLAALLGHEGGNGGESLDECLVVGKIALELVAKGIGHELDIHLLGSAYAHEMVILGEHGQQAVGSLLAKLLGKPRVKVGGDIGGIDIGDVPRHIHEERELVSHGAWIVNPGYPFVAGTLVVSGLHLSINAAGLGGGEPALTNLHTLGAPTVAVGMAQQIAMESQEKLVEAVTVEAMALGDESTPRHRGPLDGEVVGSESEIVAAQGSDIAPPRPRRDTRKAREFKDAIGSAIGIAAQHHDMSALDTDGKGIVFGDDTVDRHLASLEPPEVLVAHLVELENLYHSPRTMLGAMAGDGAHIFGKHIERHIDYARSLAHKTIFHAASTAVPDHVLGPRGKHEAA